MISRGITQCPYLKLFCNCDPWTVWIDILTFLSTLMSLLSFQIPAARCIIPIFLCGRYGSTKVSFFSSYLGKTLLAIQLHESGKNSTSVSLSYTAMLIAKPSDPKIPPEERALFKISCHNFQHLEFFSNEKIENENYFLKLKFFKALAQAPIFSGSWGLNNMKIKFYGHAGIRIEDDLIILIDRNFSICR